MFKVQAHQVKTLHWWFKIKDSIDFNPPYQRNSDIWTVYDRAFLIDSMINESAK